MRVMFMRVMFYAISFFPAPMKLKLRKQEYFLDRRRAVALLLFVCLWLTLAAGQSKPLKQITSVWTATSADGARVKIDADVPLNDYEAYRRGDRYYVRVPMSNLPSKSGSLLGRGFDDGRIQRYGDGVLFSFHLSPGTTARVDQRGDHLEIVFVTLTRNAGAVADTAGPAPSSTTGESIRVKRSSTSGHAASNSPARNVTPPTAVNPSPKPAASPKATPKQDPKVAANSSTPAPSPRSAASPKPSPSALAGSASPASTPAPKTAAAVSSPAPSSTPAPASKATMDWSSRMHYYYVWAQLNWIPLLITGLVLLLLLVMLWVWRKSKLEAAASRRAEANAAPRESKASEAEVQAPLTSGQAAPGAVAKSSIYDTVVARALMRQAAATSPAASSSFDSAPVVVTGHDEEREVFEI
jgi:hypothetical protein